MSAQPATQLLPDRHLPVPGWLPEDRRRRLSGRRVKVRIRPGVRARLRTLPRIPVSEWSERYRRMPSAESFEGKWRREFAPHAVRIMDIWAQPWVRELWFCGPDQASKTNTMLSCLGWSIERDPGNIFYTMQDEKKTKEIVGDKLIPMLRLSDPLRRLISPRADDTAIGKIRLANGVHIRAAWASSAGSTATFSAKYTFNDEVDKWESVGNETDPVRRIRKRAKNFPLDHKHFFGSTPAGRYIYKGVMACRQVIAYAGRCPHCGELILMDEAHFVIPDGWGKAEIEADPAAIGYACNACAAFWDEYDRKDAFEQGDWICIKGADIAKPETVGAHLSGMITPDMRMAAIAVTIVEARGGDVSAQKDLAHGIKCIDYEEEKLAAAEPEKVLTFRSELPRNLVPPQTAMLALLVDTQQSSFYYQLWALGYAPAVDLHMVRHGIVEQFADIEGLLERTWQCADGRNFRIVAGLIDSGGTRKGYQKHSRTVEVYDWCSRNRVMMPHKGLGGRTGDMISYKDVVTLPGTNTRIPGGLKRANLRVDTFKDELERRLAKEPDDPGALSFHCDIDAAFAKHYCAEHKDDAGNWIHDPKKGRNDYFDCTVYALALREIVKLRIPRAPETTAINHKEATSERTQQQKSRRW